MVPPFFSPHSVSDDSLGGSSHRRRSATLNIRNPCQLIHQVEEPDDLIFTEIVVADDVGKDAFGLFTLPGSACAPTLVNGFSSSRVLRSVLLRTRPWRLRGAPGL